MASFYELAAVNRRRSRLLLVATIALCAFVGGGIGLAAGAFLGGAESPAAPADPAVARDLERLDRCGSDELTFVQEAALECELLTSIPPGERRQMAARLRASAGIPAGPTPESIWRAGLIGALVGLLAGLLAAFFAATGASRFVLGVTGAREVGPEEEPVLQNVVTELSIAAGLPRPRLHLIEDSALNAFATGTSPASAHIVVTRGLLERLDRESLAGVVGHELSHIRNLDIRFALYLAGCVGLLALVGDFAYYALLGGNPFRSRGRSGRDGLGWVLLIALVLATIARGAAFLIRLAASREREYLADAGAVELTRDPLGLARALATIGADPDPLVDRANSGTQHLFFANPLRRAATSVDSGLLATHPPISDRIERLRGLAGAGSR